MSGQVTVPLPTRRQGRRGRARAADVPPGAAAPAPFPAPERIPRVARVLALAHHWQGLIRSGAVRDQAELARLVGVSRARVTQVMGLLCLAPDIQDEVLVSTALAMNAVRHRILLPIAATAEWSEQRRLWHAAAAASRCYSGG